MTNKNKRNPVTPEGLLLKNLGLFFGLIKSTAVRHDINVLCETLRGELGRQRKQGPKRTSVGGTERFFVAFFKQKYLELVDLEYRYPVKGEDFLMIKTTIQKLNEHNVRIDTYLTWVFDVFFADEFNMKSPPTLKRVCGNRILGSFMMQNRQKIQTNRRTVQQEDREDRVKQYAKRLFRATKNPKVQELLQKHNDGVLSTGVLEQRLKELDEQELT